jgi:hypothetical protein
VGGVRPVADPKIPPERSRGTYSFCRVSSYTVFYMFLSIFLGVFWGRMRYSLHVFSVRRYNSPTHHRDEHRNTNPIIGSITRRIAKQSIGSNSPHTFSQKKSHKIILKEHFFTKIPSLLKISKIPYYSTEDDIL